jgi:hypothetical protein
MDLSSRRNNFLDILFDANAIAILISIGLHAAIGAYVLPLFNQSPPPEQKNKPSTVKVVELTPSESQRIPQAPKPIATPTPSQQVLPPVYRPTTPVAPTTPKISTAPKTIPVSPVRTPAKGANTTTTPPKGPKSQQAIRQPQPPAPSFDDDPPVKPTPKPSEPPKQNISKAAPQPPIKPIEKPIEPVKKTPAPVKPQPSLPTDSDGEDNPPPDTQSDSPQTANQPSTAPQSSGAPNPSPKSQPSTQPSSNSGSDEGDGFYGKYTQAANDRLAKYIIENPGIKPYSPKSLSRKYPPGAPCSKVKQPPFIVLMVAFGAVPETPENSQESNILGTITPPIIDRPYVAGDNDTPDNKKLAALAADTALTEANTADRERPEADKNKPVLYQYRVQFDPASCRD